MRSLPSRIACWNWRIAMTPNGGPTRRRATTHIQSGLGNAELDALCEVPSGIVETDSVSRGGVPLSFEGSTNDDESVGTSVHLSAEQAEALAVDPRSD
ncbi:hypothetical protein [Natrinema altunense]|uniref:hypothetical protein n=1 Tax=Natrinema altunense TaxID=222984 RepID=UPI001023D7D2|nr:hypothetical protein [Natrinema altunense]